MKHNFIGIDLGATSGRVVLVSLDRCEDGISHIGMKVLRRFDNPIIKTGEHFYWDIYALWSEIKEGLRTAAEMGGTIDSIGVDTWGVDIVWIGKDGTILGQPIAYRDPYTQGTPEKVFDHISRHELYCRTGIQTLNFNTLFQLYAQNESGFAPKEAAAKMLFMPDAISYLLTGETVCEYTALSTSNMMNACTREIDEELLRLVGMDAAMLGRYVQPGQRIGNLSESVQAETGLGAVPVIAVAGHDTGSAVAAVPAEDGDFAYLSSGTWSLMGVELPEPILTEESEKENFTNEGGISGTVRYLKNITGMWLLEQCRKQWKAAGKEYAYPQIIAMAERAIGEKRYTIIQPDDTSLASPMRMADAIAALAGCEMADDETIATIFMSLANRYAQVFIRLQQLTGKTLNCLHVIGGGAQNELLNQLTANAVGVPVVAGPTEATVIGNAMIQAQATGVVTERKEMRRIIRQSVELKTFNPQL